MQTEKKKTEKEALTRNSDYLWDRSGEPDCEIQGLEALLGQFRHDRPAPIFPAIIPERRWTLFSWRARSLPIMAATAAVLIIAFAVFFVHGGKPALNAEAGWDVTRVAGAPRIGQTTVGGEKTNRLGVGQTLETDLQSRASLRAENVGQIEVEPGTRLRLLSMGTTLKWITLDHGTIHTQIWAPPGQFVVDTPSAVTVDLGCAYTLHVDDSGAGTVRTSMGWVGFKLNGHEAFIPAGAACATRPKLGPGTPYFEDASAELRAALARFDFEDSAPEQRSDDLAIVLGAARKRDALTLWHLLARVAEQQRVLVYDRLRELVPPPAKVTEEGVLRLNQPTLDLWWNELGFDDISVWRHWERSWSGTATPVIEK